MNPTSIRLAKKTAVGYVIPIGPVNLVFAVTDAGFVGCGAFDVAALDKFTLPAAAISGVSTIEELLAGSIVKLNESARGRGIEAGMTGRAALEKL
ncbi:MAG: YunC family protein [Kiritimatiellae bacterium]|nr:YunC family protein [Kiritimatiellia bacterium]